MNRSNAKRLSRLALAAVALLVSGGLTACGPGPVRSTTVVLTGPPDKVHALMVKHKLLASPVQAQGEPLADGRQRVTLNLPKGLPLGEVVDLGKAAAQAGVNFEFSSGTQWGSGASADGSVKNTPPRRDGPIA